MTPSINEIAVRHFDGERKRGPRHAYLLKELRAIGCRPYVDPYKNIWVEEGAGSDIILLSAHMDIDPCVKDLGFKESGTGRMGVVKGILDNAVGCYIMLMLLKNRKRIKKPENSRVIYIFTASEEAHKKDHRIFARSAKQIVRKIHKRGIKPGICVAVDVTYPRLRKMRNQIMKSHYNEFFDISDLTHCYLDGYTKASERRIGEMLIKRFGDMNVQIRKFHGHDEAYVYTKLAPSFAFGPVVYGAFDKPDQQMPLSHAKTALRFFKMLLREWKRPK